MYSAVTFISGHNVGDTN